MLKLCARTHTRTHACAHAKASCNKHQQEFPDEPESQEAPSTSERAIIESAERTCSCQNLSNRFWMDQPKHRQQLSYPYSVSSRIAPGSLTLKCQTGFVISGELESTTTVHTHACMHDKVDLISHCSRLDAMADRAHGSLHAEL